MKVVKVIYEAISVFILIVVVTLVVLLIGVRLIGFTPYVVLSGSMEPKFHVGSVVYVRDVEEDEIEVGDAITYYMADGDLVVTHEVIEIDEDNGLYYTQGIANDTADGTPATMETIIGKAYFTIPYLGYVSTYVTSPPWIYIIVALVLMWIVIMYMIDISQEEDEEEKEVTAGERRQRTSGNRKNVRRRGPRKRKGRRREE